MVLTRRALDRVPDGQFEWRPHPTSVTLGRLAEHLTEMPLWATTTLTQSDLEATVQRPANYKPPATRAEVLALFDGCLKTARAALVNKTDGEFAAPWTLEKKGTQECRRHEVRVV